MPACCVFVNFVGIANELQGINNFFRNNALIFGVAALGIKSVFNIPANPSAGGVFERLVQSVKKALYIMLKEQAPRLETLQAFLIEAIDLSTSVSRRARPFDSKSLSTGLHDPVECKETVASGAESQESDVASVVTSISIRADAQGFFIMYF